MFNIHINFWSSDYPLTSSLILPSALLASILDRGPEWVGHPDLEKIHWSWSDHNSRMKFVHSTIQWNAFYNINGSLQYFNTHLLTALYCTQLMKSNKFFHKTMIFWGIPILENYCLSVCVFLCFQKLVHHRYMRRSHCQKPEGPKARSWAPRRSSASYYITALTKTRTLASCVRPPDSGVHSPPMGKVAHDAYEDF